MNQEPDDFPFNTPIDERGYDPAASHRFPQPSRPGQTPPPPPQPPRPALSPQDERLARLRELRKQRQDIGNGPIPPGEFRRRGLPTPPPEQTPLQEVIKHWWQHGPFAGPPPGTRPPEAEAGGGNTRPSAPVPAMPTPYEERAKELLAQGRKSLSLAGIKAQEMLHQAKDLLNQKMQSQPKLPSTEEIVPGIIIVGFAPTIAREQAIREIGALGGKPLRHQAALNLFQVAVLPGQERAMIQRRLQRPGVISADLERAKPSH